MRSPIWIAALLLAWVPVVAAQSSTPDNLADVARESRTRAASTKHVWNDQNGDYDGRTAEDASTPCGAPLQSFEAGYVSSLGGKVPTDDQDKKALLRWFEKHPELDVMHPEDIAKINFPRTAAQAQTNQSMANAAADQMVRQTSAATESGNPNDVNASISAAMSIPITTNASSTLATAVRNEQARRVRSDGSETDRIEEAVNLYSICESRRMVQFQDEVDRLAKQEFQKRLRPSSEVAQGK
jgi:ATP-dependent Lon protease